MNESEITVKTLISELSTYDGEMKISFSGLDFYRLKDRGEYLQIEFNQTVFKNENGEVVIQNHK